MRISIEWLKEFVDVKEGTSALADMLSMLGFEAEVVHDFSLLSKIVIVPESVSVLISLPQA